MVATSVIPRQHDVLFGKGTAINTHPGNQRFRSLVESYKPKFLETPRDKKRNVAAEIVDEVHKWGGIFLMEDTDGGSSSNGGTSCDGGGDSNSSIHPRVLSKRWANVERDKIIMKVMKRLREKTTDDCQPKQPSTQKKKKSKNPQAKAKVSPTDKRLDSKPDSVSTNANRGSEKPPPLEAAEDMKPLSCSVEIEIRSNSPEDSKDDEWISPSENDLDFDVDPMDIHEDSASFFCDLGSLTDQDPIEFLFEGTMRDWIKRSKSIGSMSISARKRYLEKVIHILHALAVRVVHVRNEDEVTASINTMGDIIVIHPNFITSTNVIVREPMTEIIVSNEVTGEVLSDFVECGNSIFLNESSAQEDQTRMKYIAMDAFGRMAYEMCTQGGGPNIDKFCPPPRPKSSSANAPNLSDALNIQDGESKSQGEDYIICMLRKNPRMTTSERSNRSGLVSEMLSAGVPFPLCRFISDLLKDDYAENSMFGRSEHSFSSFKDVISDLKQMMENPEKFLHASSPDRWKLSFGNKLYGRDQDIRAFMDAAERVAPSKDDPLKLTVKRREVAVVSGHSGAGKSRLVYFGSVLLEKRGWRFLRCKFDRVVHPEPLSILAYAFDEYFGSFGTNTEESRRICQGLKTFISLEGLATLAKHIPSLGPFLDMRLTLDAPKVTETMMASMFLKLLKVISSKTNPILFFIDDLQWADPLSLSLLTTLVKGSDPDQLELLAASNNKQNVNQIDDLVSKDSHIMFVGSYRDNEVDEHHPLAKVLDKFQSDKSINMTNISLSRFTFETLNEMLSESLCLPMRRVRLLSEIAIQKTDGQPLHVIEFIQALTVDNLLTHSFERGWEWDADSIDIFPITESVAELYAFKLQRLPKDILLGLQILSLFGSQTDQRVISFVADYDGEESVDIPAAIQVASTEGLIEKASQLVRFSHDMIQKATADSIQGNGLVLLLRKITGALIRNASAAGELDSILFVAVDMINRIGNGSISSSKEREAFAKLNLRAASKAITVPDFSGGAKYAENGITFLSDDHWETQYELSLGLYETSVVSHFSSMESNRDQLKMRINAVFEHAKDFSDKFRTHSVWIKLLSMTDLLKAIQESLNALERLGEPLDLSNMDYKKVCDELVKCKEQFSGEREKKFSSLNRMVDCNKMRAMKIMSSLTIYYHQTQGFLGAFISCKMIQMSMEHGHCEDSVFGTAAFASALVNILEDINAGSDWGRAALSLKNVYDKKALVPSLNATIYGIVLVWKEPLQSTLEPLAEGIRLSYASGNVEFAMANIAYFIGRSFFSGKSIPVLMGELKALARQHGNHFGSDASGTHIYSPLLQFFILPLYNVLRLLEGDKCCTPVEEQSFPLDRVWILNNDEILKSTLEAGRLSVFHIVMSYETIKSFLLRDMDSALKCANLYFEHFLSKSSRMKYGEYHNMFFEALITLYFMRKTGEDHYLERGNYALKKFREWAVHSGWNFNNMLFLVEAEFYNTKNNFDKAAKYYEASVKAAREHKFIQEEAIASECAGTFFLERGLRQKAHSYLKHSLGCYEDWGAFTIAKRVTSIIQNEFGSDSMRLDAKAMMPLVPFH